MSIEPDTKDWTWVLEQPCDECGFEASLVETESVPSQIEQNASLWQVVLTRPDVGQRPLPDRWSPLEYAAHIRDVHRIFTQRIDLMRTEDDPEFENWDQDATALAENYGSQRPSVLARELAGAAAEVAAAYREVRQAEWQRTGRRSNGSRFTIETLARYHLHDLIHHAHDVAALVRAATVEAYDDFAEEYCIGSQDMADRVRRDLDEFAALVGPGGRVLEIGAGGGRDADYLERQSLRVLRSDVSEGFVRLLRAAGHRAELLDPLVDELSDPEHPDEPWDAVWGNASLLHLARRDLRTVLARLHAVTKVDGVLRFSVMEGVGETFSTHGSVGAPRHFVFWREDALRAVTHAAGWQVERIDNAPGKGRDHWLEVLARR